MFSELWEGLLKLSPALGNKVAGCIFMSERERELGHFKVLSLLSSIVGQTQEIFNSLFCFCKL